jgi:ZipA, C-terminal FtsZ-binding domain
MPQLRWTLLFLGVVFVILLAWIERRRQRQQGFTDHGTVDKDQGIEMLTGSALREPALNLPEMRARDPGPPQELPVVEIEEDSLNARRLETGEALMDPPTLSLPVLDSGPAKNRERPAEPSMAGIDSVDLPPDDEFGRRIETFDVPRLDTPAPQASARKIELESTPLTRLSSEERAFNEAVFGDPDVVTENDDGEPQASHPEGAPEIVAVPAAPLFTPADIALVTEPIVDWPPEDQRRVVAVRLVAPPPERLAGRALRLALASEGFVLGKFQIFHKPDASGHAVLSAASLSKPGTFDLETMDLQRFGGLSLFAVLPGPKPPLKAFEDLLATARNLNERLQGALQDERGGPLTPTRIATLRESLGAEAPP